MKKLFLMMPLAIFALASCNGGTEDPPVPSTDKVSVTPKSWTAKYDEVGQKQVTVTSSGDWTATVTGNEDTWIEVSPLEGGNGDVVTVEILSVNSGTENRVAVVTFTCGKKTATFTVTQEFDDEEDFEFVPMVFIEGGEFVMGEDSPEDASKIHDVSVSSFYMSKYSIRQVDYEYIMKVNPSKDNRYIGDNYPVTDVTRMDAIAFCNAASTAMDLVPAYTAGGELVAGSNGYRLPTDAQFEYAAKGGANPDYTWYPGCEHDELYQYCNAPETVNVAVPIKPVGSLLPNGAGLYDMGGNVWSMTWDWYAPYLLSDQYTELLVDPMGPSTAQVYQEGTNKPQRVIRGGAVDSTIFSCSVRSRYYDPSDTDPWDTVSFRVCLPETTWTK